MDHKSWKCDVAVIGGGAAGLAAAIRVRHVKEHEGLPLSVALFEPSQLGGLLKTGGKRLVTGPSNSVESETLLADLRADVDRYEIPVLPFRVEKIDRTFTGSFALHIQDGGVVEADAVVMATGGRAMSNELDERREGVFVTYRGVSFLSKLIERANAYADGRPVAVITNRNVRALLPLYWRHQADYLFLVPPGQEFELDNLPGSMVACKEWHIARREDDAFVLSVDTPENGIIEPWAGAILLDYVSFQKGPKLPEFSFKYKERGPGIPQVDEFLSSSVPGLYFAGDVTCRYATVTSAMADGIAAALGAYGYAFRRRFGENPPLFQMSDEHPERFFDRELPVLHADHVLRWLQTPPAGHPLGKAGNHRLEDVARETNYTLDQVFSLTYQAIRDRFVTIIPPTGGANGAN